MAEYLSQVSNLARVHTGSLFSVKSYSRQSSDAPVRTSPNLLSFVCVCVTEDVTTVSLVLQLKYTKPALSNIRPMTPICNNIDKQLK